MANCLAVWLFICLLLFWFVHFVYFFLQPPIRAMLKHDSNVLVDPAYFLQTRRRNGSELVSRHSWPYIFLYIVQHCNFCVNRIFIISDINMEYFELHGTGTVACKWQSILPNLCIILTWFQLSWYFDLFLFFLSF